MGKIKDSLKGLGRRVTLVDLIEDSVQTNGVIDKVCSEYGDVYKALYAARTGTRALLRVIGDLQAGFFGYACFADPENLPKYLIAGALGFATFYFLDDLAYEKMRLFDPYKDFRERPEKK